MVLPLAQRVKVPVILLNIQPVAAIDYEYINGLGDRGKMTGEWLAHCQACSVPEFASVFNRAGIPYEIVSGYLQDNQVVRLCVAVIENVRTDKRPFQPPFGEKCLCGFD